MAAGWLNKDILLATPQIAATLGHAGKRTSLKTGLWWTERRCNHRTCMARNFSHRQVHAQMAGLETQPYYMSPA
jgi:hypothetical protein